MNNESTLTIVTSLTPIWDTRIELRRLRGVVRLLAGLTPTPCSAAGDQFAIFTDTFEDIEERLSHAVSSLDSVIENMKIIEEI